MKTQPVIGFCKHSFRLNSPRAEWRKYSKLALNSKIETAVENHTNRSRRKRVP